jgi:hypothetical protein
MIPETINPIKTLKGTLIFSLLKSTTNVIIAEAKSMRYQTKSRASNEINFPKIAVNPHINTIT